MNADSFLNKIKGTSGICLLLSISLLAACGQSNQPSPQQLSAQTQQQAEKEPKKLKDIENGIEELVKELQGPSAPIGEEEKTEEGQQKDGQQKDGQQKDGQQKDGQQSGTQEEGSQQGGKQGQQGQQGQGQQPPQPKDPWKSVSSIINNLHFQWNEFIPEAIKKGASLKITENFSNSLNYLTTTAAAKDQNRTLLAANGLYGCIPDLYSLFRTKMSPEIKRMHYLVRNVILTSEAGDWTQTDKDMSSLKASWSVAKGSLGKEQEKDQDKLDMSFTELEKVVKAKNQQLTSIKGKVALSNIQAVEKSYEKESGNSGGGGGEGG